VVKEEEEEKQKRRDNFEKNFGILDRTKYEE
jgi:hypothetical protein